MLVVFFSSQNVNVLFEDPFEIFRVAVAFDDLFQGVEECIDDVGDLCFLGDCSLLAVFGLFQWFFKLGNSLLEFLKLFADVVSLLREGDVGWGMGFIGADLGEQFVWGEVLLWIL